MYRGGGLGLVLEGPGTRNAVHIVAVPCANWPIKDLRTPPLGTKLAVYFNCGEMIRCSVSYNHREIPRYWYRGGVHVDANTMCLMLKLIQQKQVATKMIHDILTILPV